MLGWPILGVANIRGHACIQVQKLSGIVLDSRPRGRGFEPHSRHCIVSLNKTH